MQAKFLFLGTGGSVGVPVVGCKCGVCISSSIFNKRYRPSALLSFGEKRFLIDAGPDFRDQALHFGIEKLSGVFLTHSHYDHIGGVDDLRVFFFFQNQSLPILTSKETHEVLKERYPYFFHSKGPDGQPRMLYDFHILPEDFGHLTFEGLDTQYVSYFQGHTKVTGFRFGQLAYISDIRTYEKRVVEVLKGIDFLVISALRYVPSELHFNIEDAIAFSREIGAKRTFLTHLSHDLGHDETNSKLPPDVRLAHDGLEFDVEL